MRKQTNTLISIITLYMILFVALSIEALTLSPYGQIKASQGDLIHNEWTRERVVMEEATQPDGTLITFEIVIGGENNPDWYYRKDGYTIFQDESRTYFWAIRSEDGGIKSSGYPIHLYDPEELGLEKNLKYTKERAEELRDKIRDSY